MRTILTLWLVLLSGAGVAAVEFDGARLVIGADQWREHPSDEHLSVAAVVDNLDSLKWQAPGSLEQLKSYRRTLLRLDLNVSYVGTQQPLLVIPYTFIPEIAIGLVRDGELLMWEPLDTDMGRTIKRIHRSFGMVPLPISEPGRYTLIIDGSDVANAAIVNDSQLLLEDDFVLHDYPLDVAMASAFVGALATYLLFCLALMIYSFRPLFLYASIFLSGALGAILLREGILYIPFVLDVAWWSRHILPATMGMTYAGVMLYVSADMEHTRWRGLRRVLAACGWTMLVSSLLSTMFPTREYPLMSLVGISLIGLGFTAGSVLMVLRARGGGRRDLVFALCFGTFFVVVLIRTAVALLAKTVNVPPISWYIVINLVGMYILIEYLLTLTGERIRHESRKSAESTRFDLVSRFSHELRTPLNAVIGLADLLKESRDVSQVKGYADMIHGAGHTLLGLVNDILDFSKLDQSAQVLARRPFRLDRAVSEVLYGVLPVSLERKVYAQFLVAPDVPMFLLGDELRLKQVLTNLVSNAFKYSERGGMVTLHIDEGRRDEYRVELLCRVSDTGAGMPADKLDSIFEPFTQIETADGRHRGGTGLGLAICKLLVGQMQGSISVQSELGKGTSFYFNLWFEIDPNAPDLTGCFGIFEGKRILVIAKLPSIHNQLRYALEYWGARVDCHDLTSALPTAHYDMVVVETLSGDTSICADWLQRQPANTAIHILQMHAPPWLQAFAHPNVRRLNVPRPMLSTLLQLAEHLGGSVIDIDSDTPLAPALVNRQHRVLLVDDNRVNLTVAHKLLESLALDCDLAAGGAEAVQKLESDGDYTAVLLDCEMPGVDGFEVARRWRDFEIAHGRERLPIIALTAHALNEVREECLAAGMDDVIYKPIGRKAMIELLNRIPDTVKGPRHKL